MNQDSPSKTLAAKPMLNRVKQVLRVIDTLLMPLSPIAIVGFVVLAIIVLDGFGTHVNFVRALEENGMVTSGIWRDDRLDDETAVVEINGENHDYLILHVKYYSRETLAGIHDGDEVTVRYTSPPGDVYRVILENHFDEVRSYRGYLRGIGWFLAVFWFIVVLHPQFLFLGLKETREDLQ